MSKIEYQLIIEEEKRHRAIEKESDARYQTLLEELESGGLSREEMIAHEEELELLNEEE
jgi:hypothetical protein